MPEHARERRQPDDLTRRAAIDRRPDPHYRRRARGDVEPVGPRHAGTIHQGEHGEIVRVGRRLLHPEFLKHREFLSPGLAGVDRPDARRRAL